MALTQFLKRFLRIGPEGHGYFPIIDLKYLHHFRDLMKAIDDLPDRAVYIEGAIGFHTEKDHPSEFIRRSAHLMGVGAYECAREFVLRLEQELATHNKGKEE